MNKEQIKEIELEVLIEAIYRRFHYDFRLYSRSSLRRRLEHAMIRFSCENISQIQERMLHEANFFPKLLTYLTVNTSEMFRNPTYFKSLRDNVFPFLKTFPSIKIWVAGCGQGEEVLSLSILLREAEIKRFIIYATDINPLNLEAAKLGIYERERIQQASLNYRSSGGQGSLSEYYEAAYESVRFHPELLENVVFSDHSLATDSVFSETHFISCRNVLIYFERSLQDRAIELFKDSLIHFGHLGLGNKETLEFSSSRKHFKPIDRENRIYQRLPEESHGRFA